MIDKKMAYKMYEGGFNCAQIVATACSQKCGMDEKVARAAMGGFGGGVHCGELCSAVAGAIYSLGTYCNHYEYGDVATEKKISAMTEEFISRFKDEFGSIRCGEIFREGDLAHCGEFLDKATEIVYDIIDKDNK